VPYTSVGADLKARTDAANARPAEIFVSIHQNSASSAASGTETYVKLGAPEPTQLLAATVQRSLVACLGLTDRGVRERSFYVVRNTTMPAVLVEGGFLSSTVDVALLAQPDFRQKMAEAIGGAVYQYAGLGNPGPICSGAAQGAPPPVPKAIALARAGRALTQRAGINPKRGDLWIATVRDAAGNPMSSIPLRARLPNGKGIAATSRPDGKVLIAVPRRKGRLVVSVAMPGIAVVARAEWGPDFVIHALASVDQVLAADPADYADDSYHYLWSWLDRDRGHIRSRMFANEPGVPEDEATGSAAVRLTGHLRRDLTITQGRGSQILTTWYPDGRVLVQGRVVSDGVRRLGAQPPRRTAGCQP
jgi:hypothetical protein